MASPEDLEDAVAGIRAVVRHNWRALVIVIGVLIALGGLVTQIPGVYSAIEGFLQSQTVVPPKVTARPTPLLVLLCAIGIAMLFGLLAVSGVLLYDAATLRRGKPRDQALRKAFEALTDNAREIVMKTYPSQSDPPWLFEKVCITVTVSANGDTVVEREEHVRAEGGPLHYWEVGITAEDDSTPVDFVEQLGFTVKDDTGQGSTTSVAYLVLKNTPRAKNVGLFLLPKIEPAEARARVIKTTYRWPGLSTKLRNHGRDEWSFRLKSKRPIPVVEFCVYYAPEFGTLTSRPVTPVGSPQGVEFGGMKGFKYTFTDARADAFQHILEIVRA